MKRTTAIIMVLLLLLSVAACQPSGFQQELDAGSNAFTPAPIENAASKENPENNREPNTQPAYTEPTKNTEDPVIPVEPIQNTEPPVIPVELPENTQAPPIQTEPPENTEPPESDPAPVEPPPPQVVEPVKTPPVPAPDLADRPLSDDWRDLEIAIDGKVYTWPYDYDQLQLEGFYFNPAGYDMTRLGTVEPGRPAHQTVQLYNDTTNPRFDYMMSVWFNNYSDQPRDILDCDLRNITFSVEKIDFALLEDIDIQFACGIRLGSTLQEILDAYGEPAYINYLELNDYWSLIYMDDNNGAPVVLRIKVDPEYGMFYIDLDRLAA